MKIIKNKTEFNYYKLVFVIFPMIFLTGCWDVKEVNDLAIVIATGVDQLERDKVEVTFLLYIPNPSGGSSGEQSGSSKNTYSITTTGKTFSDAITEFESRIPRRVFWGHSNVFIFDSELAKSGLRDNVDFLVRTIEPREQAEVFISKGPAKELLEKLVKMNIAELFSKVPKDRDLKSVTLKELEEILVNQSQSGVVPVSYSKKLDTASEEVNSFAVNGSAIIHHGKLVDIITGEKDAGSHWIVFPKTSVPVTVFPADTQGKVTIIPTRKSFKLIPKIEDGNWRMEIRVKGIGEIYQNTTNLDMYNESVIKQLEKELNQKVKKEIEIFLEQTQKKLQADVLQFYASFHRNFPKESEKEKENWDKKFESIEITTKVDIKITNSGVTNLHFQKNKE